MILEPGGLTGVSNIASFAPSFEGVTILYLLIALLLTPGQIIFCGAAPLKLFVCAAASPPLTRAGLFIYQRLASACRPLQ